MWITHFLLLIFLIIDTFHALPTKNFDDNSNVIVSVNAHDNGPSDHGRSSEIRHPIIQSKPRILVSYGNVYKQTPADPMQNLLMYFLMNVARDFAQDQDQFDRRRSPNFFADAKSSLTDVTGKIVNGSKRVGQKIGDSFRSITSREIPVESQYEEAHYYPHIDGTCMCFNRLVRQRPQTDIKGEDLKRNLAGEDLKGNLEIATEKKIKEDVLVTAPQLKEDKTTEVKTENHNVPVSKENSTVVTVENRPMLKENNNVVRVLKVLDLDNLKTNKASTETTAAPKEITKDVDINTMPQEILNKRNLPIETFRPPLQPPNLEGTKKETLVDNKNKSAEDDGYYFLLSSGGTDKRTTASEIKTRELKDQENLLPEHENKLVHLMEPKRKRKRHVTRLVAGDKRHKTRMEMLRERYRRRLKRQERRRGIHKLSTEEMFLRGSPNLINSDISVLMLPNLYKNEKPKLRSGETIEPPSRQKLLLTVTLPTVLGGGIMLLGLCYFLRAKGWCCQLFMDKSNIVVVAVDERRKSGKDRDSTITS